MLIRVVAVGTKMPGWVQQAVDDYSRRLPPEIGLQWREVRAEPRSGAGTAATWMQREAQRIRAALPPSAHLVVLDERGRDLATRDFAARLQRWQREGRAVAIVIGGPDGLDPELKDGAQERLRLSSLTLPHALVRVLLAEQLFRAWSLNSGHPYHRD